MVLLRVFLKIFVSVSFGDFKYVPCSLLRHFTSFLPFFSFMVAWMLERNSRCARRLQINVQYIYKKISDISAVLRVIFNILELSIFKQIVFIPLFFIYWWYLYIIYFTFKHHILLQTWRLFPFVSCFSRAKQIANYFLYFIWSTKSNQPKFIFTMNQGINVWTSLRFNRTAETVCHIKISITLIYCDFWKKTTYFLNSAEHMNLLFSVYRTI